MLTNGSTLSLSLCQRAFSSRSHLGGCLGCGGQRGGRGPSIDSASWEPGTRGSLCNVVRQGAETRSSTVSSCPAITKCCPRSQLDAANGLRHCGAPPSAYVRRWEHLWRRLCGSSEHIFLYLRQNGPIVYSLSYYYISCSDHCSANVEQLMQWSSSRPVALVGPLMLVPNSLTHQMVEGLYRRISSSRQNRLRDISPLTFREAGP